MEPISRDIPNWLEALGPLVVMDGHCTLCSAGARIIHRLDRSGTIRILPIQTDLGQAALAEFGFDPNDPETWLYCDGKALWTGLEAMVVLGARCGAWGHLLAPLRLLPSGLRTRLYRFVARNRYRVFGRTDLCALPDPALQSRLLP